MILITGANGFVGRQVVRALADKRKSLRIVVRDGESRPPLVGQSHQVVQTPNLFGASHDWWKEVLADIDTVVHLAWYTEPGKYLTSPLNLDCLQGTIEMAQACVDTGVRRFVGIGTCAEYDLSQGLLRTDSPLNPQTLYAACKASTFQILNQLLPAAGIGFVWCRLFYLHGEGEDPRRLVPYLHRQLSKGDPVELTSGRQVRDFLDVKDAGKIIAEVALGDQQGPVNICSGVPISVKQFAEKIADEYGRRDLLRFGVRPDNLFDPPFVVGVMDEMRKA